MRKNAASALLAERDAILRIYGVPSGQGLRWSFALPFALALAGLSAGCPRPAQGSPIFGNVTHSFPLNDTGYDTAGGVTADENYFHTESGIQVRDAAGNVSGTILLPGGVDVYGVAHDGANLSVSDMAGSKIYTFDGSIWNGGLDIIEGNARGLGASDSDFYLIVDSGANIARIDKTTGITNDKYAIDSILGEGLGLDYIPATNELIATNLGDTIYRLKLTTDFSSIDSWEEVIASGMGAVDLYGAGFNRSNGNLILSHSANTGLYAEGIPEPADFNSDGVVDAADYVVLKGHFGGQGAFEDGDANRDGVIDWHDLQRLKESFGQSCGPRGGTVPEPGSVCLLLCGCILPVLRRRRSLGS